MFDVAELFGYIASFFVAISLLMSSFIWLRVLNLIGAVAFIIYGSLLGSIPVVITNAFITVINVNYLIRMFRPDLNGVTYVPIGPHRRGQLDDFVAYYLDDILKFFPDFSTDRIEESFSSGGLVYLALKDAHLVGFALVHPVPEPPHSPAAADSEEPMAKVYRYIHEHLFPSRSAILSVDYIIKKYRGLGLIHRLYDAIEREEGERLSFLLAPIGRDASHHRKFLVRHGYELKKSFDDYELYAKGIAGSGPH